MPQAVWTGQLSFGLVSIPVKLYSAVTPKTVRFHQYDARTGRRIRYRRVASASSETVAAPPFDDLGEAQPSPERDEYVDPRPDEPSAPTDLGERHRGLDVPRRGEAPEEPEVAWEQIVKGYEVEPGRVVTVTPDEVMSLAPSPSRVLDVERFVRLDEIDPVFFEKSYYVVPQQGPTNERPYWLLYRAMEAASQVAIGRFVMRTKEHLAVVRPGDNVLILETLFYADEVRAVKEVWIPPAEDPPERELAVARQFIEALAAPWDPARDRDEYRERLLELLRSKVGSTREVVPEPERPPAPVTDLIEALKASVEAAQQARRQQEDSA